MNSIEIATRNYLANNGVPVHMLDDVMGASSATDFADVAAAMLVGPYGNLTPDGGTQVIDDGYVQALEETIEEIDNTVAIVGCEHAAEAIHAVFADLKERIRARIEEVTTPEPEESFEDLFQSLFGFRLEPAAR